MRSSDGKKSQDKSLSSASSSKDASSSKSSSHLPSKLKIKSILSSSKSKSSKKSNTSVAAQKKTSKSTENLDCVPSCKSVLPVTSADTPRISWTSNCSGGGSGGGSGGSGGVTKKQNKPTLSLSKVTTNLDCDDTNLMVGNGVVAYKEFSHGKHHQFVMTPNNSYSANNNKSLSCSSASKLCHATSRSNTAIDKVLKNNNSNNAKKAVVATKSWAGGELISGMSSSSMAAYNKYTHPPISNAKVASTRSFSSGLCSLIASDGANMYNSRDMIDDDLSSISSASVLNAQHHQRPVVFNCGSGNNKGKKKKDNMYSGSGGGSKLTRGNGSFSGMSTSYYQQEGGSSGPVSLDGGARSAEGLRSLINLSDIRHQVIIGSSNSSSQQALCDQCFVHNLKEQQHQQPRQMQHQHHSCRTGGSKCRCLSGNSHHSNRVLQQHQQTQLQHVQSNHQHNSDLSPLSSAALYSSSSGNHACCSGNNFATAWQEHNSGLCNRQCSSMCRCSSTDIQLMQPHYNNKSHNTRDITHSNHHSSNIMGLASSTSNSTLGLMGGTSARRCNACYSSCGYYGNSYASLQDTAGCIPHYDDYVDYTRSPYATHHSPYTSHYDTPPLSSHSPPIASSPSQHSYYSPSDSYTTPTENIQQSIVGGSVYGSGTNVMSMSARHSLDSIGAANFNSKGGINGSSGGSLSSTPGLISKTGSGSKVIIQNGSNGGGGLRGSYAMCDKCDYDCSLCSQHNKDSGGGDICSDPCKEGCGGSVCCTAIGSAGGGGSNKNSATGGCNTNINNAKNSNSSSSNTGSGRYKHYIATTMSSTPAGTKYHGYHQQECHPNWKSTESHLRGETEEEYNRHSQVQSKVSTSRSEGLLCTEL